MISSTSIKISPTHFAMKKFRTHIQGKLNFTGIIFNILETFSKTSCHTLQVMTFVCLWIIIRILIYSQIGTQLLLEWLLCVCNMGLTEEKKLWAYTGPFQERREKHHGAQTVFCLSFVYLETHSFSESLQNLIRWE